MTTSRALVGIVSLCIACSDPGAPPVPETSAVTQAAATGPEAAPRPTPPSPPPGSPAFAVPTWPSAPRRPDATFCERPADCVFTNANRGPCCVAQRGVVLARRFVNWRSAWIAGNCPANDCVEILEEPAESCAREARCVDGTCRDTCD